MAEVYCRENLPSTSSIAEVLETAKKTGFSELSLRVPQESCKKLLGVPQESRTSDVDSSVVKYYESLMKRSASLEGLERIALNEVLYRDLIPRLIRRMRGTDLVKLRADSNQIEELFEIFFEELKSNADRAGHDVEKCIQYSDAVFLRFAEMWQKTLFAEHDWLLQVQQLIVRRSEFVRTGDAVYPADLQNLESVLLHMDVRLKAIDAALVLLCWEMSRETQDGAFYLAQRHAAEICAEITGLKLKDDNHAKVVGRAGIEKLKRLGIIEVVKRGTSRKQAKDSGLDKALATTFRWCFVVHPIPEHSVRSETV